MESYCLTGSEFQFRKMESSATGMVLSEEVMVAKQCECT